MQTRNLDVIQHYYNGAIVQEYEQKRKSEPAWGAEQEALESFLQAANLPAGSSVLDIPVGTGRFLETYARHAYRVTGLDISTDMIHTARERSIHIGMQGARFDRGDATAIALPDRSIDMVISVRFLVHMEFTALRTILSELTRVSSKYVIAHIRIACPGWQPALLQQSAKSDRKLRRIFAPIKRLLKGTRSTPKLKIADKAATIHAEECVKNLFSENRLTIVRERVVNPTNEGYESRMYLLAVSDRGGL